jgi:hypothetical protein
MPLLKTNDFTHGLLTSGSYVRIRTGEPSCVSNMTDTGERWESAKGMYIQSDERGSEATSAVRLYSNLFNSRKCAAADILRSLLVFFIQNSIRCFELHPGARPEAMRIGALSWTAHGTELAADELRSRSQRRLLS